ncbi:Ras-related GTP-binding protein A [Armadillidium vulgare]|nr:Ras-related GTP-binding protein A [Armadillidium vulgare]
MGKCGSGKTSMRSIIFANYIARDTRRLGATVDVEHSHVRFLGNLMLNLWDCGGQEAFMENYFESQKQTIFRNVEVLIYVFDVESRELEKDMHYYQSCLEAILQNSPNARVFCLIHKMDLVQDDQREIIFREREEDLKKWSKPLDCTCFGTSIWDETLYKAWSRIVTELIPNVHKLEDNLKEFATIIDADEVLLFERATFLVISHYRNGTHRDMNRFEKVSNIIKQFKLSCRYTIIVLFFLIIVKWQHNFRVWKSEMPPLQLSLTRLPLIPTAWLLCQTLQYVYVLCKIFRNMEEEKEYICISHNNTEYKKCKKTF